MAVGRFGLLVFHECMFESKISIGIECQIQNFFRKKKKLKHWAKSSRPRRVLSHTIVIDVPA